VSRTKTGFAFASGTTAVALIALMPLLSAAQAPTGDWKELNKQTIALYQKGDVQGALKLGEKTVAAAAEALGPNHPALATVISNVAKMLENTGQYAARSRSARRSSGPSTSTSP
jgi:hypothetical protein